MSERLDRTFAAMQEGGEAEGLAFYHALADAELFLLLEAEAQGEVLAPRVFDLAEGPVVLAFDSEERLASFGDGPQPYAALPGRVIVGQMVGQGLALGLNLGSDAPSATILPPEALTWLHDMLDQAPPESLQARITSFHPADVPEPVLRSLSSALSGVQEALLGGVEYANGASSHLLALTGVQPEEQPKIARAVTEALAFSGLEAGALDVVFLGDDDIALRRMRAIALVMRTPQVQSEPAPAKPGPGMDPAKPPVLR